MNKKVLITGGSGYIGSILTPLLLNNNYEVTVIDSMIYSDNSILNCCSYSNFTFVKGDVTNYELINQHLHGKDIIIPLAAIVGAPACEKNPRWAREVNYNSMVNILNNINEDQWIIFPTTNSGYGIGEKDSFCTEESPLRPISQYGIEKVEIEKLVLQRKNSVSLRLATVFGISPRMRTDLLVNDFTLRAFKDKFIVLFEGHFRRNYIHVKDVTNAFLFAIQNFDVMKGEAFNVGLSSANLTKLELCQEIKNFLPELYIINAEVGEDKDKRDYLVSNEKLEKLGWAPIYTLSEGIKELIKGYSMLNVHNFKNV